MKTKFVVIDLETTGNAPQKGDRIIQIGAVVIENGVISEQFSTFVQPKRSIPRFIQELTGINDSMLEGAPLFEDIAPKVLQLLEDAYFVAHNVLFDLSFLQEELLANGFQGFYGSVIDTVELARILFPTADSYKLGDLADNLDLHHERPHQADSDAIVTAELLLYFLDRLQKLPKKTLEQLWPLSCGLKSDIALLLVEILEEKSSGYENVDTTIICRNGVYIKNSYEMEEGNELIEIPYPETDEEKIMLLKRAFSPFEKRDGQLKMIDLVYQSFNTNQHVLIEAGTGVGKTISYLLPALLFARQKQQPVVISTYTTHLQEQLLKNEIPLLKKIFPFPIRAVLLKGRGHYLHLGRFLKSLNEENDNYDVALAKMQILIWLMETVTGDKDELNLSAAGERYWHRIHCDFPFAKNVDGELNYYLQAKERALDAQLIITNHSFLMADMHAKQPILPCFEYCILDEGHQFERSARKYFADTISYLEIRTLLNQFDLYEKKEYNFKLLQLLKKYKETLGDNFLHPSEVDRLYSQVLQEMDEFFRILRIYFNKKLKKQTVNIRQSCPMERNNSKEWNSVLVSGEKFYFALRDLVQYLERSIQAIQSLEHAYTEEGSLFLSELFLYSSELSQICQKLKKILLRDEEETVSWIEMDPRSPQNTTIIYQQPVFIGAFLRDQFFRQKKSVVITSATLSVKDSFDFIIHSLGLEHLCITETIPSPFNYKEQMELIISNDLPEVNVASLDEYVAAISEHIISIAESMNGRMLVLFTSYEMLKGTYELIKESQLLEDFLLIGQGLTSGSRMRLTRTFQAHEKAILFGTNSFWEGVDIPGEDLSCLVIVRLPFSPPNEPITEAKCRKIKEEGGNPFSDFSLPEAVLRFKQGFGRLIRTKNDRGIVIIFDKRLISTTYGKVFLQSIPPVSMRICNINETLRLIKQTFD